MKSFGNLLATEPCTAGNRHSRLAHIHCNAHILNLIVKQLSKKIKLNESRNTDDDEDDKIDLRDDSGVQLDANDQEYLLKYQDLSKSVVALWHLFINLMWPLNL
jgi:ferric-dicitrate binding protein FerR (iron transport regulator)